MIPFDSCPDGDWPDGIQTWSEVPFRRGSRCEYPVIAAHLGSRQRLTRRDCQDWRQDWVTRDNHVSLLSNGLAYNCVEGTCRTLCGPADFAIGRWSASDPGFHSSIKTGVTSDGKHTVPIQPLHDRSLFSHLTICARDSQKIPIFRSAYIISLSHSPPPRSLLSLPSV